MAEWLPVSLANGMAIALFIAIAIVVLLVPRAQVLKDAPDQRSWRDIRWWAVALAVVQLGLYLLFT